MRVLFHPEFPKDIRGKIGVTNRIDFPSPANQLPEYDVRFANRSRTGTGVVTGRDAAVTPLSWVG